MGFLFLLLALLSVIIWIVDRVLLWCELRGWMSYRRMPRVRHGYGHAVLGIDALLQPGKRHVIELEVAGQDYREEDDETERAKKGLKSAPSYDRDRSREDAHRSADRGGA
jgi:hypothetical protein